MKASPTPHGRGRLQRFWQAVLAATIEVTRGRPLDEPGAALRVLPWVAASVLSLTLVPFLPSDGRTATVIAAALVAPIVAAALLLPWKRLPAWLQALPPMAPFLLVALVRSESEGAAVAYTPVVLLPVIWFALYGTQTQLLVSVLLVGVTFALPSPAIDGGAYPLIEPGAAFLWMLIAGISGLATMGLVRQRERLDATLDRLAHTDSLTRLPNRRSWDDQLERELSRADRSGAPLCAALLDLDRFKEFNDRYGHRAGDDHLVEVARAWRKRLRTADLIARYGGEEFALILTATPLSQAIEVIDLLRASVPQGQTVSGGIAQWDGSETGAELLERADRALYEAKRAGRNRTVAAGATKTPT